MGRWVDDVVPGKRGKPASTECQSVYGGPGQRPGMPAWTWQYVPLVRNWGPGKGWGW